MRHSRCSPSLRPAARAPAAQRLAAGGRARQQPGPPHGSSTHSLTQSSPPPCAQLHERLQRNASLLEGGPGSLARLTAAPLTHSLNPPPLPAPSCTSACSATPRCWRAGPAAWPASAPRHAPLCAPCCARACMHSDAARRRRRKRPPRPSSAAAQPWRCARPPGLLTHEWVRSWAGADRADRAKPRRALLGITRTRNRGTCCSGWKGESGERVPCQHALGVGSVSE